VNIQNYWNGTLSIVNPVLSASAYTDGCAVLD